MADEPQRVAELGRRESFVKELSRAAAKKALAPLAATAATAGTTYLMRKTSEIWQQRVLPNVREKGGGKALAKEALEKAAGRLGGRSSSALSGLAGRLSDDARPGGQSPAARKPAAQASTGEPDMQREQQRRKRQQRRQQRQRALEQSGST
jgi:hypothetical protein